MDNEPWKNIGLMKCKLMVKEGVGVGGRRLQGGLYEKEAKASKEPAVLPESFLYIAH